MRFLLATTTLLSLLAVAPIASADTGEERLTHTEKQTEWYGWQILATDVATVTSTYVLANVTPHEDYASINFYGGYLLGGPIVHSVHGNYGQAVGSLGLRAGVPIAGAFVGCAAYGDRDEWFGCLPGAALGFMLGAVTASAIDVSALAYGDAKPKPKPHMFEVMPSASMSKTGATFGLQGMF